MPKRKPSISLHSRLGRLTRRFSWPFVIILLTAALLLFLSGLAALFLDLAPAQRDKLFTIAKSLGVLGTALGAIQAFWKEICQKYAIIRLQHTSGHVVICGLGSMGRQLVDTFSDQNYVVAVIEANQEHPDIPGYRERGVVVLTADAADQVVLNEANIAKARFLFAVTGNDSSNIEIARQARQLAEAEAHRDDTIKLRCYSHVASAAARDIFARHDLFERTHDGYDASMFSVFDASARYLLEKHPPDHYAMHHDQSDTTLRLLVIGFGHLGEALVKQAARIGHYRHWQDVEITVVDSDAISAEARFLGAFGDGNVPPLFNVPGVTVRFISLAPENIGSLAQLYPQRVTLPATVYLTTGNDALGLSLAVRLRGILGNETLPIIVCMTSDLSNLMEGDEFTFVNDRGIQTFNPYAFASDFPILMDEVTDELAKGIHAAYCASLVGSSSGENPSLVPWRELPEDKKEANRWQADHLAIKLRAIGFDNEGVDALDRAVNDPELLTKLSEMEHRRWTAAMFLDGWHYAPGKKDSLRKTHPSLVPFADLPESERAKDDTMIRNMKVLVASPEWMRFQQYLSRL